MHKLLWSLLISGALVAGGVTAAYADSILAPFYFTVQDPQENGSTFVSIIAKDFKNPPVGPYNMQWVYWFKSSLTNLDEACARTAQTVTNAQKGNDLTTFDIATGTAFLDPPLSTGQMAPIGPTVGMFVVSNGRTDDEHSMAGEVIFVGPASLGSVVGTYRMVNDPTATTPNNFDDIAYGAFGSPVTVAPLLLWHPAGVFATRWVVSVVDSNMGDLTTTNLWVELAVARQTPGTAGTVANYQTGMYYDRDGNAISTSKTVTLRCIGALALEDLIDVGGLTSARNNGGWAHLGIVDLNAGTPAIDPPGSLDRGIIVGKVETSDVLGFFFYTSQNRQDF